MPDKTGRITLWQVEVFLATAEEGAVSAAARRLGASVSAVSQQLTALEGAMGVPLMDRSTRPVALTPAGEALKRRAQNILNEAAAARAEIAGGDMAALTSLRLGMIEDFDSDVTPQLLSSMAGELANCQFLLETGASHRLFDLLDTRALDVIVAADMGAAAEWMEVHPLMQEPFVAAVPRGAVAGEDVAGQLQKLPLIQYTTRHLMGRTISDHLARQNLRLSHRFELDSYHAIMALVAEGAGWTILTPLALGRAHRFQQSADILPLPFAPLSRTISLNARAGVLSTMPERMAGKLRPLIDTLVVTPAVERFPWLAGDLKLL
ncbi:LysR family transcriptional regulator [Vannielia litorea]|uniref:DNA-binding transcriptional regulator, LysR family n=1 Tax=Vannielia litorea TaxID=1217970 RepID=A0A1N6G9E0_9RHOB|nr:LysR family transcriptional regulator [Vannielia litorea]SIO04176.1 DNA-binding transcriptional regulator, LysR family [Vannielia litorea]